ncbi:MAG: bifunctional (p)ppGpp synthetase/guanosine-3',5'-bis(diphosphate) 3'-pyrophosphohydrolase [Bacteroidetes bacterium]|nr:bifunctional (p)ppGpp synthetase/guanosine-3',5'-bis(diphosphate) 3'-pyrophosphohydrolase [Bacteroidota bacterium]
MSQNININWEKLKQKLDFSSEIQSLLFDQAQAVYAKLSSSFSNDEQFAINKKVGGISNLLIDEVGLGFTSVMAVILWPVYDNDLIKTHELTESFDESIASILVGLKKLEGLDMSKTDIHSEHFIQLLLSLSSDVRIILIKVAERLYAIRQVEDNEGVNPRGLAKEVRDLYAPIAHRLGLYLIKNEFEEAAIKYLQAESYRHIARKLNETKKSREVYINNFVEPLDKMLKSNGLNCDIKGRPKSIHSIWNKMSMQEVEFEEVYDLFAIRVILHSSGSSEKADCWQVYSYITDIYQPNPNRLRDWISSPKPNGYESLHTTVIGPDGKWVEVQIRTKRMDEIAEHGHAAHWKYKENRGIADDDSWLGQIKAALQSPEAGDQESEHSSKTELYSNQIYIFTPESDLIKLRVGSTVLDFAFAVHSNVGVHCTGAKVNGKIVPIKHTLINGDQVEILTSAQQRPKVDWLNWIKTSKARSRIKRFLKEADYQGSEKGKDTLKRKFEQWRIKYDVTTIHRLVNFLKLKNALELYQEVADGKVDLTQIRDLLKDKDPAGHLKDKPEQDKSIDSFIKSPVRQEDYLIIDGSLDNVDYRLSKCCNPIFGDEVFGFVTVSDSTKIHRLNCPNAKQMIKRYPYRVLKVQWTDKHGDEANYSVNIRITGFDDIGIINEISRVISADLKVNMRAMNVSSDDGFFIGLITLAVQDKYHLEVIFAKLKRVKGVMNVIRSDELI